MKATTFSRLRAVAAKSPITLIHQAPASSSGAFFALALAMLVAATTPPIASAQAVAYAGSGAVNFGSVNVCPAGKATPAPCSQTLTLTYNVTASGTLGTPQALTTGASGLDYTFANGSTCVGSVVKGNTCKVNVTFAPIAPGARNGAVEIVDSGGNVVAMTYIYGTGTGPAVAFDPPGALIQFGSSLAADDVAVDASGNIFVGATFDNSVKEIVAAGGYTTINTLAAGFNEPWGVAVDGAGNVFVADTENNAVKEILRAGGYATVKTLGSGFSEPIGVAVDQSGNVFVGDFGNNAVKEVLAAGGYSTVNTLGYGFKQNYSVAVDGAENVFVADLGNNAVKEVLAAGGYTTVKTLGSGFNAPIGVALDANGNVYVANALSNNVNEILAAGGYTTVNTVSNTDYFTPYGIALDAQGNVFGAGAYGVVQELPRSQPPTLAFGSILVDTAGSPQSTTVQNVGNANLTGILSVSSNWDEVAVGGTPADCAASFSLVPSAECNLSIAFEPTETGSLTGDVTLTDNALNATDATQSIPLSGTGIYSPHIARVNTTYAAPYSVVIIDGANFGATQGSSTVTFNRGGSPHYYWTNTQIYVTVPPYATTGDLVVTVDGVASNAVAFTVVLQPTVTGISPTSGSVGTVVTIGGTNLLDYENKGSVTFNGKSLPILSQSSAAIKVAIPAGAATGDFHVLVNDTGINTSTFTVTK